jgi:hypothetical protein
MKKMKSLAYLILVLSLCLCFPFPVSAQTTLADTINVVCNNVNWQADPATLHYGVMFGKIAPNAYDSMIQSYASQADWLQVIKLKRLSEIERLLLRNY